MMIMDKKIKAIIISLLIITAVGIFVFPVMACDGTQNAEKREGAVTDKPDETTKTGALIDTISSGAAVKTDNSGNYDLPPVPEDTTGVTAPTIDHPPLAKLSATVTAQKGINEKNISIFFYLDGPGSFTIQEKESGQWHTTFENVMYSGAGGLDAGEISAEQETKTVRALKVEDGKYVAVTEEFTISRSDVDSAGGIKTYTGSQ